jgi:CubicO group peptidase (beta-lactamase class C family)
VLDLSSAPPTSRFDPILDAARQELATTRTPGAAIAVVEGDRMVWATGVGVADVETEDPVRPEMLFRLGSTTKMFTATAFVTLADWGKVSLEAPIGRVVSGLDPAISRLTPNLLLSHTAGLRDETVMFGRHDDDALAVGVRSMNQSAFFTEPGAIYSYANPGYWIAGLVVEQIAGKPYADAMVDSVFTPLGMTRSTFRPMMAMTFPLAQGHQDSSSNTPTVIRPAADNVANWPAGSMFSNVHDLSRFVIAFLNGGTIDGRQVLSPQVISTLSAPHASIPGEGSYGYGLNLIDRHGVHLVQHNGSRSGYGSTIMMAPSRRAGVIVLGNRSGSGLPKTAERALELLLDLPAGALAAPSPTVDTPKADAAKAPVDYSAWIGRYTQGAEATLEIATNQGHLVCREGTRDLGAREISAGLDGSRRLAVGGGAGSQPTIWVLVPDRDGKPTYVFRGGRAFKRVGS